MAAFRTIGKAEVRNDDPRLRKDDIVRAMRPVVGYMTRTEKKDLIRSYDLSKNCLTFDWTSHVIMIRIG